MSRSRIAGVVVMFAAAIAWLVAAANAELPPLSEFDQHTYLQYASNLNSGRSNVGIWFNEATVAVWRPPFLRPDDGWNAFRPDEMAVTTWVVPVWLLAVGCIAIFGAGVVLSVTSRRRLGTQEQGRA